MQYLLVVVRAYRGYLAAEGGKRNGIKTALCHRSGGSGRDWMRPDETTSDLIPGGVPVDYVRYVAGYGSAVAAFEANEGNDILNQPLEL